MGCQSQRREGSIKACKKAASKRKSKHKLTQRTMVGGEVFDPEKDCKQCVAVTKKNCGLRASIPHRPHHKRCPKNRKTRGSSETSVFIMREAERNIRLNTTPFTMGNDGVYRNPINPVAWSNFFQPRAAYQPLPGLVEPTNIVHTATSIDKNKSPTQQKKSRFDATILRRVIDERMHEHKNERKYQWLDGFRYSKPIGLLADYVYELCTFRKPKSTADPFFGSNHEAEGLANFNSIFVHGSLKFELPPELFSPAAANRQAPPSPYYDSIVGLTLLYIDWRLVVDSRLPCPNCLNNYDEPSSCPSLCHDCTNWSRNKSLFPLVTGTGAPMLAFVMYYKCEECKRTFPANDGRILMTLPANVRDLYPVLPRYARGTFHLTEDASSNLEYLMRTYANASFVNRVWYQKLGAKYERKVGVYLAKNPKADFVPYWTHIKGLLPPSPSSLRLVFLEAEKSELNPYGYSFLARYELELQAVGVQEGETLAIDWTFQSIKNYINLPGAKGIFTAMTGKSKEIVAVAIVGSTAVKEVAHLLVEMVRKRPLFAPSVLYTDTCPNNDGFWKKILGQHVEHKLGLFHLMQRIVDTLDNRSERYWEALTRLKDCLYSYVAEDLAALKNALKDGSFSSDSKRYSDDEIEALRQSKRSARQISVP
jgi:hypothetical protein